RSELREAGIEKRCEGQRRQAGRVFGLPDHVKNHLLIIRIDVMPMGLPIAAPQVEFDIAGEHQAVIEAEHGTLEVRAALAVPEAGMQDLQAPAVEGDKFVPANALMKPDGLEQTF